MIKPVREHCNAWRRPLPLHSLLLLFVLFLCGTGTSQAQVAIDSSGIKLIQITHTDNILKREGDVFQRFVGSVQIEHDGFTMTCDSAFLFPDKNYVEAFGNVNILKANGTNVHSDYMRYTGSNSTAFLKGNVSITDAANSLFTQELIYNIKTKIGKYTQGGTLTAEGTTVNSRLGNYNGFTQQTWFKDSVVVSNEKYSIESKELTYNIKTKVVKILDESVIYTENSTIWSRSGTYDSKNTQAVFNSRTTVESDDQIIIGNALTYNDQSGMGKAKGDVYVIDTKNETKLTADEAEYNKLTGYGKATGHVRIESEGGKSILRSEVTEYNKKTGYAIARGKVIFEHTVQQTSLLPGIMEYHAFSKFMLATVNPKLITVADGDSLFMRADTMYSLRIQDREKLKWIPELSSAKKSPTAYRYSLLYADSTYRNPDPKQEEPKLIIGHRNIKLFSDSMQAVCDSLSYSQADSTFRLYKNPVMWSKNQQSHADTVFIKTIDNKLSEVNLRNNALLVSLTGYENVYDQVSGLFIDAFFERNEIQRVHVDQNAESIYYAKDDAGAYIGTNRAESAEMTVFFINKEVDHILFVNDPKGNFYPIDQLTDTIRYLNSFKLFTERKPKSKEEVMQDAMPAHMQTEQAGQ